MKKTILVYGIIAGLAVAAPMLIMVNYMSHCEGSMDYDSSMFIGYAVMLVAFSMVYVGIRNYRNNFNGGVISFGKAFKVGTLIVLIASTIYVVGWLIDYFFFIPDFGEKYAAHMLEELKASGASAAEIEKQTKEMAYFSTLYKNPFFNAMVTYMEILPVGLIVTLISALILKRKPAEKLA